MKTQSKGFTLIELIMVIVILGILSAFALPRFADFGTSAREATLDGAVGSVRSAAGIARSSWLINDETSPVDLDGVDIVMSAAGYPDTVEDNGIADAAQLSDDFVIVGDFEQDTITYQLRADCSFTYDRTNGSVTTDKDDC